MTVSKEDVKVGVKVDVTQIVKYMCISGTVIVAIVFGCNLWKTAANAKKEN